MTSVGSYGSTDTPRARTEQVDAGPSGIQGVCSEDYLRRKLKYFFMNPCEKWRAKRKFPWKMVLQVIKIVLVTVQLWQFGLARSAHIDFLEKSTISFKHLYLLNWTSGLETMPYPPSAGTFALYTVQQFYESVSYTLQRYEQTEDIAMGTYQFHRPSQTNHSHIPPVELCNTHYRLSNNWAHNHSYKFDARRITDCYNVSSIQLINNETGKMEKTYNVEHILKANNFSINFDGVNNIKLKFRLTALHLKYLSRVNKPDCYVFHITILYDNQEHDGQMKVTLEDYAEALECFGEINYDGGLLSAALYSTIFDISVILISVVSCALCMRSIYRGIKLRKETIRLFRRKYHKDLDLSDQMEFFNMWYLLIILNDIMTISGSGAKIAIENRFSRDYETCGILLGTGSLLVWFGVLRYLGFFEKYNVLILTMKKSTPNVLRFLVCAAVFYFGFTICGWVVLGPYHIKFKTLSSSAQFLFCAISRDGLFQLFATNSDSSVPEPSNIAIKWLSNVYIKIYIVIFSIVAVGILFSIIYDNFSNIQFRHLSSASECLFSLVNGDDMYVTFAAIKSTNAYIWWYSRIFLYIFISLFIYVILSVFISVIMDTYETIKRYYKEGFPKSDLQTFIEECTDDAHTLFRSYSTDKLRARLGSSVGGAGGGGGGCPGLCGCLPIPAIACTGCDCCQGSDVSDEVIRDQASERQSLIT